jgi:hypothetical protein
VIKETREVVDGAEWKAIELITEYGIVGVVFRVQRSATASVDLWRSLILLVIVTRRDER